MKVYYFIYLLFFALCADIARAETVRHFASSMPEAKWEVAATPLNCQIKQKIPSYGDAVFFHSHTDVSRFILRSWMGNDHRARVHVVAKQPVWKRDARTYPVLDTVLQRGKNLVQLRGESADLLLSQLQRGLLTRFIYESAINEKVKVDLSVINFQEAYKEYVLCVGRLSPYAFRDVAQTVIYFDPSSHDLSRKVLRELDKVITYANADSKIRVIKIEGYTDNDGGNAENIYLSELRAKAVRNYLITHDVSDEKIKTTWYGYRKPVSDNDSVMGRALNRRVTLKLLY